MGGFTRDKLLQRLRELWLQQSCFTTSITLLNPSHLRLLCFLNMETLDGVDVPEQVGGLPGCCVRHRLYTGDGCSTTPAAGNPARPADSSHIS